MKHPWYIWLSLPMFVFLWFDSAGRLTSTRTAAFLGDQNKMVLWMNCIKNFIELTLVFFGVPTVMLIVCVNWLALRDPYWGITAQYASYFLIYLLGVYITHRHNSWREENIPHLLKKKG